MEKIKKENIVTAISIYSSRVSSCIAILDEGMRPNIAGLGKTDGKLLGSKGVLDIDILSRTIRRSLDAAREEANIASPKAFVSITGGSINSEKSRGMVKLSQKGKEITDRDVRAALKVANTIPINVAKEIIHSIPQDFIVDGQDDIKEPVGLHGVKLETEALLITAHIPFLQNVIKALNLAGVELEDVVFSGIALSQCLLSQETEKKGVILIEIDSNFTAVSFFFDNILRGINIQPKSVIIDGVLEVLKESVDRIRNNKPISKIILTGGGYIHEDFIEKADSVFGIPSQIAYARNIIGSSKDINNPAHLTAIGLALYGFEKRRDKVALRKGKLGILQRATRRMGEFLEEYF